MLLGLTGAFTASAALGPLAGARLAASRSCPAKGIPCCG